MKKGWEKVELGTMSTIMYGHTAKSASDKAGPKYLRITDIQESSVNWDTVPHCDDLADDLQKYQLADGDIVFARTGATTGKSFLITCVPPSVFASYLIRVQADSTTVSRPYLYKYFQCHDYWEKIKAGTSGSAQGGFNAKKLAALQIPIPPLSEQEEIVEVLDKAFAAIDQAKANIEQNIANAKELFQSKLNQIFSQKGEGWVETRLGDLITVKHGFAFKSQFFTTEGEHVLLTPGNYYEDGGYRDRGSKQKYYVGEIPDGYILKKDDLLLAMTEQAAGLLGSPLLVPEPDRFLHNQRLGLVQHISPRPPSNRFLYHTFNTKSFRDEIYNTGTGVKVRHTSPTKICDTKINITFDAEIQEKVVNTLESLRIQTDAVVIEYQTKLASLDELKKSILQKAFAGELT